jgi:hypothetical protein
MKRLTTIWNDLRRGQNIDLLLTIIVSFILLLLGIFGVTAPELVSSLTLAVLGLIAISSLESRYQVEELALKLGQIPESIFLKEFPSDLDMDIRNSKELWLIGVTLSRTIKTYYPVFEEKLKHGFQIMVILINPQGSALEMSVKPVYGNKSIEQRRAEVVVSLESLCDLKARYPDLLHIKISDNYIGHGVIGIDPNSTTGKLYVEMHPFKMPGGSQPKFVLESKDGEWFDFFKQETQTIWENCSEWICKQL